MAGAVFLVALVASFARPSQPYAVPATAPRLAAFVEPSSCATADALRQDGLLAEAHDQYTSLLGQATDSVCAVGGLQQVAQQSKAADELEADGDAAATQGDMSKARHDYTLALKKDTSNQAALSGLEKLDQQKPDSIRQARDFWNQIVTNTLVPIGQFFLWLLAVFAGIYVLYLLTRVAARWLPIKPMPASRTKIKICALSAFILAVAAIGATAGLGVSGHRFGSAAGVWWLVLLITNGALIVIGCLLSAWHLRSGSRVQFSVTNESGSIDNTACAFLAGRLSSLGAKPPRGFDLPQGTDVTSLTGVLTLLPGGGMLSALASLLLARVPVTPWSAAVTLVDKDQFLVTLHRNGRMKETRLVDRDSLFFPSLASGQDPPPTAAYVQIIDRCDLLTIAAVVILVSMARADKRSPLQAGLNGATSWKSVAGQVLATGQGLDGNEGFSRALLERALDVDPGNLGARVARVTMDGRRASDAPSRKAFAKQISEIADLPELRERGYEALRLRVLYSSAAGWCNAYLDDGTLQTWNHACVRTARLIGTLYAANAASRPTVGRAAPSLAELMQPEAYFLWTALFGFDVNPPPEGFGPVDQAVIRNAVKDWKPVGPQTSSTSYAGACLMAVRGCYGEALQSLKRAVEVDDSLRTWARSDPSFSGLRANRPWAFLRIVGDQPPGSFTEIGPMAKYTKQLSDIGVHNGGDLDALTGNDAKLQLFAQAVGVSQLVVARWRSIAGLAGLSSGPAPGQLDLLVTVGVDSVRALRAAVEKDLDQLVSDLATAGMHSSVEISAADLTRWAHARQARPTAGART
jgi:hypothetical protein